MRKLLSLLLALVMLFAFFACGSQENTAEATVSETYDGTTKNLDATADTDEGDNGESKIYESGEMAYLQTEYGDYHFGVLSAKILPATNRRDEVYQISWEVDNDDFEEYVCIDPDSLRVVGSNGFIVSPLTKGNDEEWKNYNAYVYPGEKCVYAHTFAIDDPECEYLDVTLTSRQVTYRVYIERDNSVTMAGTDYESVQLSAKETALIINDLYNYATIEFLESIQDFLLFYVDDGNGYFSIQVSTSDIYNLESQWSTTYDDATELYDLLDSHDPDALFSGTYEKGIEVVSLVKDTSQLLSDFDTDGDGKYSDEETAAVMSSAKDSFDEALNCISGFIDSYAEECEYSAVFVEAINSDSSNITAAPIYDVETVDAIISSSMLFDVTCDELESGYKFTVRATNDCDYNISGFHIEFTLIDENNEPVDTTRCEADDIFYAHETMLFTFNTDYLISNNISWNYEKIVDESGEWITFAETTATPAPTQKPSATPSSSSTTSNSTTSNTGVTSSSTYTGSYDAQLSYGSGSVIVFASEDAMDRYMTALAKGYQGTIDEMVANGEVGYTAKDTKCNIVEEHFTKAKVKLLEGAYEGSTVWVVIEALQKK